ncbi:GMC family oxidoreductase [Burkholderia stagnalis]
MTTRMKRADIAIVGMGWCGTILAKELSETGLSIVGFERGPARQTYPDFSYPLKDDELRFQQRNELMLNLQRETITFRNDMSQTALPMRQHGSFVMGEGVGGSGTHWGGVTWRWLPWDHAPRQRLTERYGASFIPSEMTIQDWAVGYAELEPYYERFERTCAVSGKAGNLNGTLMPGGNPFEAPRRSDYPNPPLTPSNAMVMMADAARRLGLHPFIAPAAISSRPYQNPDGVQYGVCHYNGFCERFGCPSDAKAHPVHTMMPLLKDRPNFELRTHAQVLKINLSPDGKHATGVTYLDARGEEIEQPADLVIVSAYSLFNVHLMLLSDIGTPYDPVSGKGVVGRNYAYQCQGVVTAFLDDKTWLNPWMGSGGLQMTLDDYNVESNDFAKLGFIGGATIATASNGSRPISFHPVPPGTPQWGSAWKRAVVDNYQHTMFIQAQGSGMSYRSNYLDLDPTYRDAFGRPMLRMTFDFNPNEVKMANYGVDQCARIAREAGAKQIDQHNATTRYSVVPYQSTHNTGGAIMGVDRETSALNRYLQSWDVSNVFVVGGSAIPQNAGKNPTGPIGALTYWAADAIRHRYLKSPGALA